MNRIDCEFSNRDNGKLMCGAESNTQPCIYIRYCTQDSCWYNSNAYLNCKKRQEKMGKNDNYNNYNKQKEQKVELKEKEVEIKEEVKKEIKEVEKKVEEVKEKKTGTVVFVGKTYIVIEVKENGFRIPKQENKIYNVGDIVEF